MDCGGFLYTVCRPKRCKLYCCKNQLIPAWIPRAPPPGGWSLMPATRKAAFILLNALVKSPLFRNVWAALMKWTPLAKFAWLGGASAIRISPNPATFTGGNWPSALFGRAARSTPADPTTAPSPIANKGCIYDLGQKRTAISTPKPSTPPRPPATAPHAE